MALYFGASAISVRRSAQNLKQTEYHLDHYPTINALPQFRGALFNCDCRASKQPSVNNGGGAAITLFAECSNSQLMLLLPQRLVK